jgi:UDP-N-acetylglucosamine--N-acetylmuramyl-(pentapeptide) pyrophosphoryl-undecaprenol N-acetylglucosamine transferase
MWPFPSTWSRPAPRRPTSAPWVSAGPPRYVFAGGGSGGHLFPGIAVAESLCRRWPGAEALFLIGSRPIEQQIVEQSGFAFSILQPCSLKEALWRPDRFVWQNTRAVQHAYQRLVDFRPQVVIGLGGLTSVPTAYAAFRLKIPVLLLEQNTIPGMANGWLSRWADLVCTSFEETHDWLPRSARPLCCGNPVRDSIRALCVPHGPAPISAGTALRTHQLRDSAVTSGPPRRRLAAAQCDERPTLLVLGGSQGAEGLNDAMLSLITHHGGPWQRWHIVHQAGPRQTAQLQAAYDRQQISAEVHRFIDDMPAAYRRASMVISRAGATTLAELACVGRPMILIPFPHAAANHQQVNASVYARNGAAQIVRQQASAAATAAALAPVLSQLLMDPQRRQAMAETARQLAQPDAADRICELLLGPLRVAA